MSANTLDYWLGLGPLIIANIAFFAVIIGTVLDKWNKRKKR